MLEEDYLALSKNTPRLNSLGSQIIREILLPALEKEINEGKNFASLRQIVSGMILATWYKKAFKESLLGKIYTDKAKIKGINQDPRANEAIYQQYLKAFKKGVYNFIREDEDKYTHQSVPRKYFAGGFDRRGLVVRVDQAQASLDKVDLSQVDRAETAFQISFELPKNAGPALKNVEKYRKSGVKNFTAVHLPYSTRWESLTRSTRKLQRLWASRKTLLSKQPDPLKTPNIEEYGIMITVANNGSRKKTIRSRLIASAQKGSGLFIVSRRRINPNG